MKLRIRGNSLRLRLTRGEVDTVASNGRVEDQCGFGPAVRLRYALVSDEAAIVTSATFDEGAITVRIPEPVVSSWAASEEVSLRGRQLVHGDESLEILVEKDFACLQPREGEDESDNFPHPDAHC